jgi:hypothetical protein
MFAVSPLKGFSEDDLDHYADEIGDCIQNVFPSYYVDVSLNEIAGIAKVKHGDPSAFEIIANKRLEEDGDIQDRLTIKLLSVGRNLGLKNLAVGKDALDYFCKRSGHSPVNDNCLNPDRAKNEPRRNSFPTFIDSKIV